MSLLVDTSATNEHARAPQIDPRSVLGDWGKLVRGGDVQ